MSQAKVALKRGQVARSNCFSDTVPNCSNAGQLFIVHTIKSYGALLFATVMTTRQFLSILLSCILYRHPLTAGQWYAISNSPPATQQQNSLIC